MGTEATLLKLPGYQQLLDRLVEDVRQRRSVVIAVPALFHGIAFGSMLRYRLSSLGFDVRDVVLAMTGQDSSPGSPVTILTQLLGIKWESAMPRTPAALIAQMPKDHLPFDVIHITGIGDLTPSEQSAWFEMFEVWGQASQNCIDQGEDPIVLLAIVPVSSVDGLPKPNTHLAIHWFWGITSALEARLYCRIKQGDEQPSALSRWREYILSSLAAGDIDLIEFLWSDVRLDVSSLIERLCVYSEKQGWSAADFKDIDLRSLMRWERHHNNRQGYSPPPEILAMWACGAAYMTVEYGVEIHPSVLALCHMEEQLAHRLWRGQAELILPLIDQIRLQLCGYLTTKYGEGWPSLWELPESPEEQKAVIENPLAAEWGYLDRLLKSRRELHAERRWQALLPTARRLRNQIAHYQPIHYHEFEAFLNQTRSVLSI